MTLITTTELRTKSKELIAALLAGQSVRLIHRSRIVGEIKPKRQKAKIIDAKKLGEKINELNFPRLTTKEIDSRYRIAMMKKHGQGLSRR